MTNREWLIKVLEEGNEACTVFLNCDACEYRFTDCASKKCLRGYEKWLNKEHVARGSADCKKCKFYDETEEPPCVLWDKGAKIGVKDCPRYEEGKKCRQ